MRLKANHTLRKRRWVNVETNRYKAQEGNQNNARDGEQERPVHGCRQPLEEDSREARGSTFGETAAKTFQIQLKLKPYRADMAYLTLTEHSIQPQQKHATFKVEYLAKIDLFGNREQFSNILKGFNSCNAYSLITVELNLNPIQERFLWNPLIIEN